MTGTFITFEGPEGAGKTTQIRLAAEALERQGCDVTVTREPGGTPEGEQVRAALLSPEADWSPLAEMLLMNAARDAHLRRVVLPALARGAVVLCDRFCDSTRAYQGGGGGLAPELMGAVERAVCTRMPDLTLVFDLPPEEGLARAAARGQADRFEAKGFEYHARVAEAFRRIAATEARCTLLDASGSEAEVAARVSAAIDTHLARSAP